MLDIIQEWFAQHHKGDSGYSLSDMLFDAIENDISAMILTDNRGTILYVNQRMLRLFGYDSRQEVLQLSAPDLFSSHHIIEVSDLSLSKESGIVDYQVIRKDNTTFYVSLTNSVLVNQNGDEVGWYISLYDITRRRKVEAALQKTSEALAEANKQLALLATHDGLTGLLNRRAFDEHLAKEFRRCEREKAPLSLLFIDVDYFKKYNDFYGHLAGDSCLQAVAEVLSQSEVGHRPGDCIARYGGEEFVLLLSGTHKADALRIAKFFLESMRKRSIAHAASLLPEKIVTLSIGVASLMSVENTLPEMLLKRADEALYDAKSAGRNQVASL